MRQAGQHSLLIPALRWQRQISKFKASWMDRQSALQSSRTIPKGPGSTHQRAWHAMYTWKPNMQKHAIALI